MESKLSPGDKVRIYFDPVTEEYYEGDARLIERKEETGVYEGRKLVFWLIRFRGETQKLYRLVWEPMCYPEENEETQDGNCIPPAL